MSPSVSASGPSCWSPGGTAPRNPSPQRGEQAAATQVTPSLGRELRTSLPGTRRGRRGHGEPSSLGQRRGVHRGTAAGDCANLILPSSILLLPGRRAPLQEGWFWAVYLRQQWSSRGESWAADQGGRCSLGVFWRGHPRLSSDVLYFLASHLPVVHPDHSTEEGAPCRARQWTARQTG